MNSQYKSINNIKAREKHHKNRKHYMFLYAQKI